MDLLTFFNQVNLLLMCSPKIHIDPAVLIIVCLQPFAHHKVFPKRPAILAQGKRIKIIDERVADPGIDKIYFSVFVCIGLCVSSERSEQVANSQVR